MRILHLHERTELKGGAEVYIDQLNRLLPDYGHQSYWLGQDKLGDKPEKILANFIREKAIDIISIHNIFDSNLVSFCLDSLPVIKFAHGPVMVCPGKDKFWRYSETPCAIKYGLHCFKHIYTEGCANRHPNRVFKAWNYVNFEIENASKRYHKIVVMSDFIKRGLVECGVSDDKIICNPYFTPDVPEFSFSPVAAAKNIIFLGRLISSKGPHFMLKAVEPLLKEREDVYLNIVGNGIMRDELVQTVKRLGLDPKVIFHGWLNRRETEKLLQESYLLLFPSIYPEAFGIVGIEAMMRGKPVVAFDVGGVRTWLEDEVTGYLIQTKDIDAMRQKTEMILDDSHLYHRLSSNARTKALEFFTESVHMNRLLAVYESAIT